MEESHPKEEQVIAEQVEEQTTTRMEDLPGSVKSELKKRKRTKSEEKSANSKEMDELEKTCDDLIDSMRNAIEEDYDSMQKGKPALKRLRLIPRISQELYNKKVQRFFLKKGGLELLHQWISKQPNGDQPSLNLCMGILPIIYEMDISYSQLQNSTIGPTIRALKRLYSELEPLVKKIVDKWTRVALDASETTDEDEELSLIHI
eukprot:TRINITY_DN13084_c0_g1_i3.p1 TRINITY_DN13084_c0_g1~~TRINITY_DN13084_c0_g1_i3.p1  ORF type:complete len:204 (+),score=46.35 TRINITY_DN13084_c0_g1_i3:54-665(+)